MSLSTNHEALSAVAGVLQRWSRALDTASTTGLADDAVRAIPAQAHELSQTASARLRQLVSGVDLIEHLDTVARHTDAGAFDAALRDSQKAARITDSLVRRFTPNWGLPEGAAVRSS